LYIECEEKRKSRDYGFLLGDGGEKDRILASLTNIFKKVLLNIFTYKHFLNLLNNQYKYLIINKLTC